MVGHRFMYSFLYSMHITFVCCWEPFAGNSSDFNSTKCLGFWNKILLFSNSCNEILLFFPWVAHNSRLQPIRILSIMYVKPAAAQQFVHSAMFIEIREELYCQYCTWEVNSGNSKWLIKRNYLKSPEHYRLSANHDSSVGWVFNVVPSSSATPEVFTQYLQLPELNWA